MPYLGTFWPEFQKAIAIIEIRTLKFVQLQSFVKKQKHLSLGPKMPHLGIFGLEFENSIVIFKITRVCLAAKFRERMKIPTFGTRNALFGYFWSRIFKKLLLYLKSAPSNFSNSRVLRKNKKT